MDIERLREWLGKTAVAEDQVTPVPSAALSATLNHEPAPPHAGDPLPPLWHWLYLLPLQRQDRLGPDGHALRGGFLPAVALPRRMWAGGRLRFHHPLRCGDRITRVSRIADISYKEGRSGPLVFVLVRHEISNDAGLAISEEHDIVYRDHPHHPQPDAAQPKAQSAPNHALWSRRTTCCCFAIRH